MIILFRKPKSHLNTLQNKGTLTMNFKSAEHAMLQTNYDLTILEASIVQNQLETEPSFEEMT